MRRGEQANIDVSASPATGLGTCTAHFLPSAVSATHDGGDGFSWHTRTRHSSPSLAPSVRCLPASLPALRCQAFAESHII